VKPPSFIRLDDEARSVRPTPDGTALLIGGRRADRRVELRTGKRRRLDRTREDLPALGTSPIVRVAEDGLHLLDAGSLE
jgi:hypothetical protein